MPTTTPFQEGILSKIRAKTQAARFSAVLSDVRQFRAYCCNISANAILGVSKEPVIFLSITPNPICLGHGITWSFAGSYAPGSTLTGWEIDFGDMTNTGGSDFPNDTTSGSHTYATAGTYTITATIEEGLGLSTEIETQVEVLECGTIGPASIFDSWTYLSLDGGGVYFIDWSEDSPTWIAKNAGLTEDALLVRDLEIKPGTKHLSPGSHELWIATKDGVYRTYDGGSTWEKLVMGTPDNSYFAISPALTESDLDWHKVVFNPLDEDMVFVLASKKS